MVNIEAVYSAYVRKVSEGNYLIGQLSFVTIKGKVRRIVRDIIVYREGDIVKQPMKKGSFVPKNVPGVGWGGWVMKGWGGVGGSWGDEVGCCGS